MELSIENKLLQENRESFLDYINEKTVLVIQNTELLGQQLDKLFDKANEAFEKLSKDIQHAPPEELFLNSIIVTQSHYFIFTLMN